MEDGPSIANRFAYEKLQEDSFRLLNLGNSTDGKLVVTLNTVSLKDAPAYHTLSYSWSVGPRRPDVELAIDGYSLIVTATLSDALHRLCDVPEEGFDWECTTSEDGFNWDPKHGWIWIDQICINQEDMDEREAQVSLMGAIYSSAIRTIIWLGPVEDRCDLAWPLIHQMYAVFRQENPHAVYLADIPFRLYSDEAHANRGLPGFDDEIWTHFRRLFGAPWFRRIWVAQEAALSPRDPAVLHGPHVHSWERLGLVASWLRKSGYLRLGHMPNSLANVDTISNLRRSKRWKLNALIFTTSIKFHASNRRDKVYGLLGLSEEYQDRSKIPRMLMPDYELDVATVYRNATRHILNESDNLSVFTRIGIFKDRSLIGSRGPIGRSAKDGGVLPSWVPNWDDITEEWEESITRSGLSWAYYSNTGEATRLGYLERYNASGGLPPDLPAHVASEDPNVLRIGGLDTDKIAAVVPWDDSREDDPALFQFWRVASRRSCYNTIPALVAAIIKVTTAEQYNLGGRQETQLHKDGAAYMLSVFPGRADDPRLQDLRFPPHEVVESLKHLGTGGNPEQYERLARNYSSTRSFYVTSKQGCLGIGPMPTREGDSVAVLLGGGVPYVLRPQDGRFVMVGESYVVGLMEGQAIQDWRAGKLEKQVFELV